MDPVSTPPKIGPIKKRKSKKEKEQFCPVKANFLQHSKSGMCQPLPLKIWFEDVDISCSIAVSCSVMMSRFGAAFKTSLKVSRGLANTGMVKLDIKLQL